VRSTVGRVLTAVLVSLALALVVVGAAVRGTLPPLNSGRADSELVPVPDPTGLESPPPEYGFFGERGEDAGPDWSELDLTWVAVVAGIIALIFAAGIVAQPARRFTRITTSGPVAAETVAVAEDDDEGLIEEHLPALLRGVEAAQESLAKHPVPSDAVVAAWLQLEEAAAESGLVRPPAQTPAEFTVTVLAATRADEAATLELLQLYHRARFSRHPVGPAEVAAATDCLTRISAGWARRVGSEAE
jgi:hypothetical protein